MEMAKRLIPRWLEWEAQWSPRKAGKTQEEWKCLQDSATGESRGRVEPSRGDVGGSQIPVGAVPLDSPEAGPITRFKRDTGREKQCARGCCRSYNVPLLDGLLSVRWSLE